MAQDHDGLKGDDGPDLATAGDACEGVVALDGQVEQAAGEAEAEADAEDEGDDEDEGEEAEAAVAAAPADFVPQDPDMLLGEARDHVLGAIRRSPAWAKLGEKDQRSLANEVEQAQRQVIRGAYRATAAMDLTTIEVTIKDPGLKSEKEQIEAKIIMDDDADAWMRLRDQKKCTLVFADVDRLMNARAAAVMKDQPTLFGDETPDAKAKRERIDRDAEEREASLARARQFKPLDDAPPTIDNATGDVVADAPPAPLTVAPAAPAMSDAERKAYERGVARRAHGGVRTLPEDLLDKDMVGDSAEPRAFHAGYDAEPAEPTPAPTKAPRRHRGPRAATTTEERVAKRQAETADA